MTNLSRMERRANDRKAKKQVKRAKLIAIGMTGLVATGGLVTPAMASTTTTTHDVYQNYSEWDIKGKHGLSDADKDSVLKSAVGVMTGEVKLSMSDADQKKLKDAGVTLNLASTEKLTNKAIAESNHLGVTEIGGSPNYSLKYDLTYDMTKMKSVAKELGLSFEAMKDMDSDFNVNDQFTFGHINSANDATVSDNIATDAVWQKPTQKKGQSIPEISMGAINNGSTKTGIFDGAHVFPVSTTTGNGIVEAGESASSINSTTLVDPYSDGDSAKRIADISSTSKRSLSGEISNCVVAGADCGVYFAVAVTHDGGTTLLTDPVRLDVKSTVSAGKTPTDKVLKNGDMVTFTPKAYPVEGDWQSDGNWFLTNKVGAWESLADYKELFKAINGEANTNFNGVTIDGDNLTLDIDSKISVSYGSKMLNPKTIEISFTSEAKTNWEWKGNEITSADLGTPMPVAKGITIEWKSVDSKNLVAQVVNTSGEFDDASQVEADIQLGIISRWFGGAHQISQSPTIYSVAVTKAMPEPEKPLEPKPEPEPEKPVEPKPEPEPTPEPEPSPKPLPKPEAIKDTKTGKQGEPVTVKVMENDTVSKGFTYKAKSLRLVSPETKKQVTSYTFDNKGTYEVQGESVVFTPEADFAGKAPVIGYSWVETNGAVEQSADSTVQVTLTEEKNPVIDPEPTPKPVPEKEKPTPKPVPTEKPKPVVDPEPTDDPKPISDDEKPEPKPVVDKKDKVIEDKPTEGDGGKSEPEKVEEGINNSGADTATVMVGGGGFLATLAGFFLLRIRKVKTIKPAKKH